MKSLAFAGRNRKEILRDPMTLIFGMVLPILMLWLFSMMPENMPFELFTLENLAPGIIVFSFSFITLFNGMLIGRDKSSSFLMRIFASPMTAADFMVGYALPLLPVAIIQITTCYLTAVLLGMPFNWDALSAFGVLLFISLLYIAFGLMFGTFFTDRQVGGIFAVFVNITASLSGIWFEPAMIGSTFETVAYLLPFAHAVDATRAAFAGEYGNLLSPLIWVAGYTAVVFTIAVLGFKKRMKN